MVLALDRLLPSRACLHPHIDQVKLQGETEKAKLELKIELKQVNHI
jgi:hypothetical protein